MGDAQRAVHELQTLFCDMHAVAKLDPSTAAPATLARCISRVVRHCATPPDGSSPTAPQPAQQSWAELQREADQALEQGAPVRAAALYGRALRSVCRDRATNATDLAAITIRRANALLQGGQVSDALADAGSACRLAPASADAWLCRALAGVAALEAGSTADRDTPAKDRVKEWLARAAEASAGAATRDGGASTRQTLRQLAFRLDSAKNPPRNAQTTSQTDADGSGEQVAEQGFRGAAESRRPGIGRCVVARAAVDRGAEVLSERASAVVVSDEKADTRCHHCFEPLPLAFLPCCECGDAVYCSERCLSRAATAHRAAECRSEHGESDVRLALRLLRAPPRCADALVANLHLLPPDTVVRLARRANAVAADLAARTFRAGDSAPPPTPDAEQVLVGLCQVQMNSVGVTGYRRGRSGVLTQFRLARGLFCGASALNHSCMPTVQLSFRGAVLVGRARGRIRAGDELTISYGPTAGFDPGDTRRRQLRTQYCFDCGCPACQTERSDSPTPAASTAALPPAPTSPTLANAEAVIEAARVAPHALSPPQLQRLVAAADVVWRERSGAPNVQTARALDTVAQAAAGCNRLALAGVWLTRAVETLERAVGTHDVAVGFEHIKLAECLLSSGHRDQAARSAKRAAEVVRANLGRDSPVVNAEIDALAAAVGLSL